MLARHLLFLATRRPKKASLQLTEPVSTCSQQQNQQPPPYVGPPQVQKLPINNQYPNQIAQNKQIRNFTSNNQQHIIDPYQKLICEKNQLQRQNQLPPHQTYNHSNYTENQKIYAQQFHHPLQQSYDKVQQQFYTLPNKRAQREVIMEPPRSITPDITRGLSRGPLNAMHMLAKQGQNSNSNEKLVSPYHHYYYYHHYNQNQVGQNYHQNDMNRKNVEQQQQLEPRFKYTPVQVQQHQQRQAPVDVKNRFASPVNLSALGYRLFTSPIQENLKNVPISPIGPEHANGFKSSTPTNNHRATPTVAERLALSAQRCASPNPALMNVISTEMKKQQQILTSGSDSGRSTPTNNYNNSNIILSPIKSTMSNEELFVAIHKSKKRLNIKGDETETLSPAGSLTSLSKNQQIIGTRHSWSPESQKTPEIPKSVLSPSTTSRMDFKRLLLQQSIKSGPVRISATEQLKLSRQNQESQQQQTPPTPKTNQQLGKVMSPRSAWRFQTPRTDVLSSIIIEDTAAEEKAMKPSPDTPSPVSRFPPVPTSRRQLDLTNDKSNSSLNLEELKNVINENKNSQQQQRPLEKSEKDFENRLQAIVLDNSSNSSCNDNSCNNKTTKNVQNDNPIKAIESRRMSNQLARAQFLAGSASTTTYPQKDLFDKRFRARSESPRQNAHQNNNNNTEEHTTKANSQIESSTVTRSPSAPTLETAL